jgi:hypothetical protein
MNELIVGKNQTNALHIDDSGFYQGIRELVVAVVTSYNDEPFDWAAYRAFVPVNMDIELGKEIISDKGDKLHREDARPLFPTLDKVPYRS